MTQETGEIEIDGVSYDIPKPVWNAFYELMAERNALQDLVMEFNSRGMLLLKTDEEIESFKMRMN